VSTLMEVLPSRIRPRLPRSCDPTTIRSHFFSFASLMIASGACCSLAWQT
jgi:hypothetical protein